MKKSVIIFEVLILLVALVAVYRFRDNMERREIREELEVMAYEVTENIYQDNAGYFKGKTSPLAIMTIREAMDQVRGRKVQAVVVETYDDKSLGDNRILVVHKIDEAPFERTVVHRMVFFMDENRWKVDEFESEAR